MRIAGKSPLGGLLAGGLGVEEEYHLVAPDTLRLLARPALAAQAERHEPGSHLQPEMLTSQLEAATDVCSSLDDVRTAVLAMRAEAASAAAEHGAVLLATSTHPQALLAEVDVGRQARYERLVERFAATVGQLNLCGCHVHVSVPGLDAAVAVMNHARPYLPVLAALTASSPFHEGRDSGYDSVRLARLTLWPHGGPPPYLDGTRDYLDVVERLIEIGVIGAPSELLWELRPSARYSTLEFRVADMCPDVDDVVLYAGLVRSLVRTLSARVAAGVPAPHLPDAVLAAARWRAARYGLAGTLWGPQREVLVPGPEAVGELWRTLVPDLTRHGEAHTIGALLRQLLRRGTSATRQRRVLAETGSLSAVVRDGLILTAARPGGRDRAGTASGTAAG